MNLPVTGTPFNYKWQSYFKYHITTYTWGADRNGAISACYHVPRPDKRFSNVMSSNSRKSNAIFAKQHQERNVKLIVNKNPPQLISAATLHCKM